MKKLSLLKDPMDESLVREGDNGKAATNDFKPFIAIVTLITSAVAIVKSLFVFPGLSEEMQSLIQAGVAVLLSFGSSFLIKYLITLVSNSRRNKWIKSKKKVWVKGVWFHTHVKENGAIRVGYVVIQQYFDLVKAKGHNISLGEDPNRKDWEYLTGKVNSESGKIVCVFSSRRDNRIENIGTHIFNVVEDTEGFPLELNGKFNDTINNDFKDSLKGSIGSKKELYAKLGEHYGTVFLFRPSSEILESLTEKGKKAPSLDLIRKYALDIKKAYEDNSNLDSEGYDAFGKGIINALKKSDEKKRLLK